jgi:hypothetical protein
MLGKTWFGKIAVNIWGKEKWEKQDATQVWSDGGSVRDLLDNLKADFSRAVDGTVKEIERTVAENAVTAASEFASLGQAALQAGENGEVILGVLIDSGQCQQIIEVPLRHLFKEALMQARPTLGTNPESQEIVSSVLQIAQQLVQALTPPRERPAGLGVEPPRNPNLNGGTHQQMAAGTNKPRQPGRVVGQRNIPEFPGPVMG